MSDVNDRPTCKMVSAETKCFNGLRRCCPHFAVTAEKCWYRMPFYYNAFRQFCYHFVHIALILLSSSSMIRVLSNSRMFTNAKLEQIAMSFKADKTTRHDQVD
jgi:hypothetical protein